MRIHKLVFENINSLRGVHTIDFQEEPAFRSSNLFAITGPTGAGKTTILDVVTLALYHRTPRLGEVTTGQLEKLGAILTRDTDQALAEVTFSTPAGIFRAKWSLKREIISRGANKGQARLEEYAEIADVEKDEIIASKKKKEVQEEIRKRIGLDYEQFVKAILLSQGDFAAFLKAKREERAELLERITGTEIYRRLGMEAYARWNDGYRLEIDQKKQQIDLQKLLKEEEVEDFRKLIAEYEEKSRQAEAGRKELEQHLQRKNRQAEVHRQLQAIQAADWPRWETENRQFEEQVLPAFRRHEQVQQFSIQLSDYQINESSLAQAVALQQRLSADRLRAVENRDQLLKAITALTGKAVTGDTAAETIAAFRDTVSAQAALRQEAGRKWESAREEAAYWLSKIPVPELHTTWKQEAYAEVLESSRGQWKEAQRRLQELKEALNVGDDLRERQVQAQERRDGLRELETQVSQYEQLRKRLTEYDRQSEEQQEKKKHSLATETAAHQRWEKVRKTWLDAQQEQLAFIRETSIPRLQNELKEGEPCPVCGSAHHPVVHGKEEAFRIENYLTELETLKVKAEQLEQQTSLAEKEWRHAESVRQSAETTLAALDREKAAAQAELHPIAERINTSKTRLNIEKIGKSEDIRGWIQGETDVLRQLEEMSGLQERSESLAQFGRFLKAGLEHFREQQEAAARLRELYPKEPRLLNPECDELLRKLVQKEYSPALYDAECKEADDTAGRLEKAFQTLKNVLLADLRPLGFESVAEARRAILPHEETRRIAEQKEALSRRKTQMETSIGTLSKEAEELLAADTSELTPEVLLKRIDDYKIDEREFQQKIGGWKQMLLDNETSRSEHARRLEEITILEQKYLKWRLLSEALGDREGRRFNQFAQKLTLANLVRSANGRLKDLSDRYLLLPPDKDEETLRVLDRHFDESRAVSTLSGGETFLVSLALALGLSDMVSKNVRIESLFIDEGFGTLDPETLETALGTLEKLQAESNRLIGVISHVEALKERITTQIRLTKQANGFSKLEIVG